MTSSRNSVIDFDAIEGGGLVPLASPLLCRCCLDSASIVVDGLFLCGDCFLEKSAATGAPRAGSCS